jgi:hypothetical protein
MGNDAVGKTGGFLVEHRLKLLSVETSESALRVDRLKMNAQPIFVAPHRRAFPFPTIEGEVGVLHEVLPFFRRRWRIGSAVDWIEYCIQLTASLCLRHRRDRPQSPLSPMAVFPPLCDPLSIDLFQTSFLIPPSHDRIPLMRLRRQCLAMIGSYQLWFRWTQATAEGFPDEQDFAFQDELPATD